MSATPPPPPPQPPAPADDCTERGTEIPWKLDVERWRGALEGYVQKVQPGNQRALNEARVAFAQYLNAVHNRLHPLFADQFLASLTKLEHCHQLNDPSLRAKLEIVVDGDGKIARLGVLESSGVVAFDVAALEALDRAQPFGAAPDAIRSPDGMVYFHWEFYRLPNYACSTYYAHPFRLKQSP